MLEQPPNALYAYVGAFLDELARSGVRHVCICPGSRSTPLAICSARHAGLKIWMHLDERSAAFFALGLAKTSREPVALVCTSGTAAANFMPAVVEARLAHVPLLLLTADRPPELRDVGAPQTIDQVRLYGSHVKWCVDMATPGASDDLLRYARATACRAVATALAVPRGPVHLNFPFREPLVPVRAPEEIPATLSPVVLHGRPSGRPYVDVPRAGSMQRPAAAMLDEIADLILRTPRGVIVCGPLEVDGVAEPAGALAALAGYPIVADALSGLRAGSHDQTLVIDAYDAFLRASAVVQRLEPGLVLRLGATPTSKPLQQYLQRHPSCPHVVVSHGDWQDPALQAGIMFDADPAIVCRQLACRIEARHDPAIAGDASWRNDWLDTNRRAREALERELASIDEPFEGRVFAELRTLLPGGSTLWVGSSMPVRDLDTFFGKTSRPIRILANRGANGIDGVISSALGAAAARPGPHVLVIGDISFYHDMNGLLAAARYGLDLTVILLNNDGGGIFSFLPQAEEVSLLDEGDEGRSPFEQLFGTPHGLDFAHAATLYSATFVRAGTWPGFRGAVEAGIEAGGLHIVEVRTERRRNVVLHRRCWPAVAEAATRS